MFQQKDKELALALVTDASSGIGYELSKQFARNGFNLILIADSPAIVEVAQVCEALGSHVEKHQLDLGQLEGVSKLFDIVMRQGKLIDSIVFNATHARHDEIYLLNHNIIAPVEMLKLLSKTMLKKETGKILFTAFSQETLPDHIHTIFEATLSFLDSYCFGMRKNLKDQGIQITSLITGKNLKKMELNSEDIAQACFDALMANEEEVNLDRFTKIDLIKAKH